MNAPQSPADNVFERRFVSAGAVIVHQNDYGNEAFLIQSGSVKVYTEDSRNVRVDLGVLNAGEIFGEMALTVGGLRTATVEAVEDSTLIVLTSETLNLKLKKSDPTVRAIVRMLIRRLQLGNNALLGRAGTIEEMLDTVRNIYANIYASLPPAKRQSMENIVRPRLEDLLSAITDFRERHGD